MKNLPHQYYAIFAGILAKPLFFKFIVKNQTKNRYYFAFEYAVIEMKFR